MPEVPKIVHDRLRAAQAQGAHPEADLLAAFAEQALSDSERENVLAHLAACRDCREVTALGAPQLEVVAQPSADEKVAPTTQPVRVITHPPRWLSWPSLHWAAVAAGVVVVASVLMLRHSKEQPSMVAIVNEQAEQSRPAAPEAKPALPETAMDIAESAAPAPTRATRANETRFSQDESRLRQPVAGRVALVPPVAQPSVGKREFATLADSKRRDAGETDKLALKTAPPPSAAAIGGMASREQVEVTAGSAPVATESSTIAPAAPVQKGMIARNEPSLEITKAKKASAAKEEAAPAKAQAQSDFAATQELTANAYSASKQDGLMRKAMATKDTAVGAWRLAQGVLFRAEGKTWKVALQAARPLIAFGARAGDVWAGGQAGMLFQSRDNGTTWTQVQPSTQSASLTSDIVAIELRSATDVVLTTANNESWSSSDGGKSWEKK
jgi:hypothetical protein